MVFYVATENPNVMMRENHKTKSSKYIFICQDDLYIASTTPEEILNLLKDKYKINIYLEGKNLNMLFNNKLPTDLYTTFQIIKLLIKKGNLNLIHNKNYISTLYIKFHQVKHYIHLKIPIYKKEEKMIHEFILYTRNFLHDMESKYCIMGSINQN